MEKIFRNKQAFTLIELLVVIAIIGILSTVSITSLNSARLKARDAVRQSDIAQVRLLLEISYDKNEAYPAAACSGEEPTTEGWTALMTSLKNDGLIDVDFLDPKNTDPYLYQYCVPTVGASAGKYRIHYTLEYEGPTGYCIGYPCP